MVDVVRAEQCLNLMACDWLVEAKLAFLLVDTVSSFRNDCGGDLRTDAFISFIYPFLSKIFYFNRYVWFPHTLINEKLTDLKKKGLCFKHFVNQ